MTQGKEIWVVTAESTEAQEVSGARSGRDGGNPWHQKAAQTVASGVKVSADTLQKNMSEFLGLVGNLFHQAENTTGMKLDEVELSVEVTGDGEVKLVGSGIGVEAKGAITLKFKRDSKPVEDPPQPPLEKEGVSP
ncbi:hypothetical protein Lepto7376_3026 [[Leptolyngbya] sp. PCC 7376]|uniref:Pepco domain-containing protein n=1 Tax=[Leptolyngbya] sp. PCC 7376 TaxID=111781 RepID=UPI00029F0154|nr:hypothetical protein [[Leptolyngbya] sp. PCC 7376]AFY39267.1 hypothetical protein Lepto7376_3026 [[Leptolyngbya] sp. PCC 7376]